jgi:multiple sugar transport system permease protein
MAAASAAAASAAATASERASRRRARRLGDAVRGLGVHLAVLVWLLIALGPYVWMFLTSVKPSLELYEFPVRYLPSAVGFEAYEQLFTTTPFARFFANSAIVAAATVAFTTTVATLAAYALSRFRIPGKPIILVILLVTQLMPAVLLVIPLFISLRGLGLLNTWYGLTLVHSAFALPFTTYLVTGFLDAIPKELDEAAKIDGCSDLGAFRWVVLPLLAPSLAAASTYVFIYSWNEFIYALTFMTRESARTLPVGLHGFIGEFLIRWDLLTAGGVIATLPTVLFFLLVQRRLIAGLTAGAVKG